MAECNKEKKEKNPDLLNEKFLETRTVLLTGEVNKELADKVIRQLLLLESISSDPIKIFIDSPGGDVDAGFAIFDMIRFITPKVTLVGMGLVASAAALILLAVPKNQRVGLPNSRYLLHQPMSGRMQGVATDLAIHAEEIEKTRAKINAVIAKATGTALAKVAADTERDFWLDANESLDYGLIHKVVSTRKEL